MAYAENVKIKYFWTNAINNEAILDFIQVLNQVFTSNFNRYKFNRKYENNIYGPSIIVLAYVGNKCVGARAFWRNDLNGSKAYQPADTAVLKDYRGFGIFTKMTHKALEVIEKDALVYNFPNDNSLPGYLKMGWDFLSRKRYKIYNPFKDYIKIEKMDEDYLSWLLADQEYDFNTSLYHSCIKGKYFLVKKRKYNLYVIIAEIDKRASIYFPMAKFPIHLCYSINGYLGRGLVTVVRNFDKSIDIPLYKIDTIF